MENIRTSSALKSERAEVRIHEREVWFTNRGEMLRFIRAIEKYQHPKKRLITNVLALVSRTIGMTLGTILIIFLIVSLLNIFVSLPIIGQLIQDFLAWVEVFQRTKGAA